MAENAKALLNVSYRSLRRWIGILGVLLPWLLMLRTWQIEPSISHYYYTAASPIFTGILIAFGLLLLTYQGYEKTEKEKVSDNTITNLAGFFALITAILPTSCYDGQLHTFCHFDSTLNTIHLLSAGAFLILVGAMSYFKFPLGGTKKAFYKTMGIIVWASIAFMLIYFALEEKIGDNFPQGVLVGEIIGVSAFGISWLVKGKPGEMKLFGGSKT
ncbi:hypothetical protein [Ekhidna sp.]|uniref:hypothetical protein n=1 Tax=Ekhidna sp. TaxID=2608089 RepID=UPI003CCC29DD